MAVQELTPDQIKAAELLASGMGKQKTAEAVGVSRATLHLWRQIPKFSDAYLKACARAHRETIAAVQRTSKKATSTLVKALNNPDANVAVRAALGLLANGWKASEHYVLDERVKALEESERAQPGSAGAEPGGEEERTDQGPSPDVVSLPAG